jgi:hypothetical protein
MFSLDIFLAASSENTEVHTALSGFSHLRHGRGRAQQNV